MKTTVSVQEISELDIKPGTVVAQWRTLVVEDIQRLWKDQSHWIQVSWPGCGPGDTQPAFSRHGFIYVECRACGSLFAPLRPDENDLWAWYREGRAARFWHEKMLTASKAARLEKMIRPRADWVLQGISEYVPRARHLADISTFGRDLIDIVEKEHVQIETIHSAGITADYEGSDTKKIKVHPARLSELPMLGPVDVVTAIDIFDRAVDLGALVAACRRMLRPGGVLFATIPVASGFEIQALWEHSPTVFPPDRLNLPSVKSLTRIFAEPSWTILELSTPGMFDVEVVRRTIRDNPDADWPRVVCSLVMDVPESNQTSFIEFLQSNRLSSFARLVARKEC